MRWPVRVGQPSNMNQVWGTGVRQSRHNGTARENPRQPKMPKLLSLIKKENFTYKNMIQQCHDAAKDPLCSLPRGQRAADLDALFEQDWANGTQRMLATAWGECFFFFFFFTRLFDVC